MRVQNDNIAFGVKIKKTPALEVYLSKMRKKDLLDLKESIIKIGKVAPDDVLELRGSDGVKKITSPCDVFYTLVNVKNNEYLNIDSTKALSSTLKELSNPYSELHYQLFKSKTCAELKQDIFDLLI